MTVDIVMRALGIDINTAEAIVDKLGGEGCLEDDEVEGQWKVIKKVVESSTIPKFIGRKKGRKSCGRRGAPGASPRGEAVKNKEDGEDDGACGSGVRKEGSMDNDTKGAK